MHVSEGNVLVPWFRIKRRLYSHVNLCPLTVSEDTNKQSNQRSDTLTFPASLAKGVLILLLYMSAESSAPVFVPLPSVMASVAFCRSCNGRSSGQRFPLTAALASVVVLLLSALQVSGQNATAMLLSSAENCTNANGEPQFCAPWPPATSILDDVDMLSSIRPSVTATSTCDSSLYNETDMFCGPTGCEQFCPNGTSIENLLMGQGVMTGLGWMSEPTANDTQVIVDIDLGRVYVLLELTLVFPNATVPELFRVERSSSNTAVGSASFSVVPSLDAVNASSDETVMTTTLADDIKYNGYLATANGIALVSQNLATRHVRIVFMQPGMDSNVTDSTTGTSSSFYALSEIRLRGLCQCNGHALACNNSVCQCEHSTTGVDCSTCDTTDSLFVTSAQYSVASRASGANSCRKYNALLMTMMQAVGLLLNASIFVDGFLALEGGTVLLE